MPPLMTMITPLLTLLLSPTFALHADEAGLTDFLLRTPGHGHHGVRYAQTLPGNYVWVTSEFGPGALASSDENELNDGGCYVAARNVTDGNVLWRVDACSTPNGRHVTIVDGDIIHTLDDGGILKGWNINGLQWDADVISDAGGDFAVQLRLVSAAADKSIVGAVLTKQNDEHVMLYNSLTGEIINEAPISAKKMLQDAKIKSPSKTQIISLIPGNKMGILSGYSNKNEVSLNSMGYTQLEDNKPVYSSPLKISGDVGNAAMSASSVKVVAHKEKAYVMGVDKAKKSIVIANFDTDGKGSGKSVSIETNPTSIEFDVAGSEAVVRVTRMSGSNRVESAFILGEDSGGITFEEVSVGDAETLIYCAHMNVALGVSTSSQDGSAVISSSAGSMEGDTVLIPSSLGAGKVESAHLINCKTDSMVAAFTAQGGLTVAVSVIKNGNTLVAKQLWSTEEALGSITAAVFLDETHVRSMRSDGSVNADDEEENALQNLQFSHRMQSQLASLKDFALGGGILSSLASVALMSEEKKTERNYHFGFAKLSVLLSESKHRIIALDTAKRGKVVWAMNLNPDSTMHNIVHGGQSVSLNDPHGYGGVHDHELLVLSQVPKESSIEWRCFDGMTGKVFSKDVVKVSSGVAQIVPLRSLTHHSSHDGSCRQVALLIHEDDSVTLIPNTARSYATLDEAASTMGKSGLFVHTIDKTSGEFRAMRVSRKKDASLEPGSKSFELVTVGTALFDPSQERIVNVAYPQRGEVIQSPSTVLGDDALLLKYLNPHLVVVVTEATKSFLAEVSIDSEEGDTKSSFYKALSSGNGSFGQKRKPLGASKPGEAPPAATNVMPPSLFITLIDSVSGQILHRASHTHVTEDEITEEAPTNVPVVISENWVVYTFFNQRTRRTDVGVLTLHEGMIDKNGLTAFSGPEQELTFSSLESAKPIVLSKTFGLAKAITSLGVTITKAGISSKQFLFATGNGQVISMDRRLMDPRRPTGEVKPTEKMEGLVKYAPLLPIMPIRTPSHVYEVSDVNFISSTTANVESQSLMLAYGGPDVFFTRLAPSKGFDLLPDDFNRGLLTVVVLGMAFVLVSIQGMNKKKMMSSSWS